MISGITRKILCRQLLVRNGEKSSARNLLTKRKVPERPYDKSIHERKDGISPFGYLLLVSLKIS